MGDQEAGPRPDVPSWGRALTRDSLALRFAIAPLFLAVLGVGVGLLARYGRWDMLVGAGIAAAVLWPLALARASWIRTTFANGVRVDAVIEKAAPTYAIATVRYTAGGTEHRRTIKLQTKHPEQFAGAEGRAIGLVVHRGDPKRVYYEGTFSEP